MGCFEGIAETFPDFFSHRRNIDLTVQGFKHSCGNGSRMVVAGLFGDIFLHQPAGCLKIEHEHHCLQQGGLHPLSLSGTLALQQRQQDPHGAQESRGKVGDRNARAHGSLSGKARHRHQPSDPLQNLIESLTVPVRTSLAETGDAIGLPHPVHIHANNLGLPGNWTTTLETMKALEGHRGHFAHIQFHSYGGGSEEEDSFGSRVPELADYVNQHPNISLDVGQVLFGETTSMTGDGPLGYYLHQVTGRKWFSGDTEMETGCGIVPIRYKNKSYVHAMQWAIGLEWYLLVKNPWQIAMSTDHPNGGSFLAYPQIIRFLMDRTYRQDILKTVHPKVLKKSVLKDIDREYTLNEIAIITRAAPARMLGLMHKGHLGPGADADLTVYNPNKDKEVMFRFPRYVIKSGIVVSEDGDLRGDYFGKTLHVTPAYDPGVIPDIQTWFEQHYTIQFANYPIDKSYFPDHEITKCHPNPE